MEEDRRAQVQVQVQVRFQKGVPRRLRALEHALSAERDVVVVAAAAAAAEDAEPWADGSATASYDYWVGRMDCGVMAVQNYTTSSEEESRRQNWGCLEEDSSKEEDQHAVMTTVVLALDVTRLAAEQDLVSFAQNQEAVVWRQEALEGADASWNLPEALIVDRFDEDFPTANRQTARLVVHCSTAWRHRCPSKPD